MIELVSRKCAALPVGLQEQPVTAFLHSPQLLSLSCLKVRQGSNLAVGATLQLPRDRIWDHSSMHDHNRLESNRKCMS